MLYKKTSAIGKGKTIVSNGRIIVIGDAHGCYREVEMMLDMLNVTPDDDVIFAGDMVDGGEDSRKVVEIAMDNHAVMGNHELHHVDPYIDEVYSKNSDKKRHEWHLKTKSELLLHHREYLRSLPHYIRLPQYNTIVAHAGMFPGTPLEKQKIRHLTSMQAINPEIDRRTYWMGQATLSTKGRPDDSYRFWTHFWRGPERIIFGHSVLNKPLLTEFAIGIDGGCRYGGELWAYVMPEEKIYRIKSMQPKGSDWVGHVIDEKNDVRTF